MFWNRVRIYIYIYIYKHIYKFKRGLDAESLVLGSAWWIASHRRKPEIISPMGLPRCSKIMQAFVCLWAVCEVCGCFLKPSLFSIVVYPRLWKPQVDIIVVCIFCICSIWARELFVNLIEMGSVKQRISSRWVQSDTVFLRDGHSQTTTSMSLNHWHKEPSNKL